MSDRLTGEPKVGALAEGIEDCVWLIDALILVVERDELDEVEEIRRVLVDWQGGLPGSMATPAARAAAHEQTIAWSARLTWVAALLEATR